MVGDKLETDILGGLEAGLAATVWIPLSARYNLTETDPQPHYILRNVMELKYLLLNAHEFETKLACLQTSKGLKKPKDSLKKNSDVFRPEEDSNSNASDGI